MSLKSHFVSLEALAFQNRKLFEELTLRVKVLREKVSGNNNKVTSALFDEVGFSKLIQDQTNMSVQILPGGPSFAAFVLWPNWNANHPLIKVSKRMGINSRGAIAAIAKSKDGFVEGAFDTQTGKVKGVFAEIDNTVVIGNRFFTDTKFTAEEVAAIICHELGHLGTYYEMFSRLFSANHAIETAVSEVMATQDREVRVRIIMDTAKALNGKIVDAEALANGTTAKGYRAVFIDCAVKAARSEYGSNIYDQKAAEFLADQWANRQGAGKHLALALDKLHRHSTFFKVFNQDYRHPIAHMGIELMKTIGALALVSGGLYTVAFALWSAGESNRYLSDYDTLNSRFMRIRNDLVQGLKVKGISAEQESILQEEIDTLDRLLADVHENRSFYEFMWTKVLPSNRREVKAMEIQQQIESLMANDLFVKSSKLKAGK